VGKRPFPILKKYRLVGINRDLNKILMLLFYRKIACISDDTDFFLEVFCIKKTACFYGEILI